MTIPVTVPVKGATGHNMCNAEREEKDGTPHTCTATAPTRTGLYTSRQGGEARKPSGHTVGKHFPLLPLESGTVAITSHSLNIRMVNKIFKELFWNKGLIIQILVGWQVHCGVRHVFPLPL